MVNLISGSYQRELNNFFQILMGFDVPKRFVSKVALSKARLKLKYEAFVELNRHLVEYFFRHFESVSKWHGFNLLVVDGSLIRLPSILPHGIQLEVMSVPWPGLRCYLIHSTASPLMPLLVPSILASVNLPRDIF